MSVVGPGQSAGSPDRQGDTDGRGSAREGGTRADRVRSGERAWKAVDRSARRAESRHSETSVEHSEDRDERAKDRVQSAEDNGERSGRAEYSKGNTEEAANGDRSESHRQR